MKRAQCTGFVVNRPKRLRRANHQYTTFIKVLVENRYSDIDEFVYVKLPEYLVKHTGWFSFKTRVYIEGWFEAFAFIKDGKAVAQCWVNSNYIEFLDKAPDKLLSEAEYSDLVINC